MMKFLKKFKGTYFDITVVLTLWLYVFLTKNSFGHWQIFGLILTFLSAILWLFARFELNDAFAVKPMAKKIVKTGIYSKIRHPIYTSSILIGLGFCLLFQKWFVYLIYAGLVIMQVTRARQEEKILTKTFDQEYIKYKKSTWF